MASQLCTSLLLSLFGNWEIVDRMGTKSRTCRNELALCDPFNTLTYHSTFYMRFVPRGNSEERVAGGKNETNLVSKRA